MAVITGNNTNESLAGGANQDTISGRGGNDTLIGNGKTDRLYGELGNDTLFGGDATDYLYGGNGNDSLFGGAGSDSLYGGLNNDRLEGGSQNDRLFGEDGRDSLIGGTESDSLYGGNQNDVLSGDSGSDSLYGGSEHDILFGGASGDRMDGGAGNDLLEGGNDVDTLTGGSGDDLFQWLQADIDFSVVGQPGVPVGLRSSLESDVGRTSDTPQFDTWLRDNVGGGGSVGVTSDYPRDGEGSVFLGGLDADTSGNYKADWEYFWDPTKGPDGDAGTTADNAPRLIDITSLSYDFFRDGESDANPILHPSLRIGYDADGDTGTTADRGFLVFERAYNTTGPVAEDTWVHNEILDFRGILGTAFMWLTNPGNAAGTIEEVYNRDLEDWVTTANPNSAYPTLGADTVVTGISIGIGSGWTGDFQGAIDNVQIGFNGEETSWNFEPPTASGQPDIVTDFVSGNDTLSLRGVLDGYTDGVSDIEDFVKTQADGTDLIVLVNEDGSGGDFVPFARLEDVAAINLDNDIIII
jgi:hypothetical protein